MKRFFPHLLLCVGCLFVSPSLLALPHSPQSVLEKIRKQEPSFPELVTQALKEEHLGWEGVNRLKRKMRQAPLLPVLSMGYDRQFRKYQSVSFTDNISVTSSAVTVGPPDNNEDFSVNHSDVFRVRASWNLSELVFHSAGLKLADAERDLSEARLRLIELLFKTYAERRSLLARYFAPVTSSAKKQLLYEQIRILAEKMDAQTGGVFQGRWWKGKEGQ